MRYKIINCDICKKEATATSFTVVIENELATYGDLIGKFDVCKTCFVEIQRKWSEIFKKQCY